MQFFQDSVNSSHSCCAA